MCTSKRTKSPFYDIQDNRLDAKTIPLGPIQNDEQRFNVEIM